MENEYNLLLKEYNSSFKECNEIYRKIAAKLGISESEFMVLYALVEINAVRQKDIVDYFSISKQTINSAVKKLVRNQIVELKQAKGREMQIILTPAGKIFTQEKMAPIVNCEKKALAAMGKKESQELVRLTKMYLENFKGQIKQIL